IRGGDGAMRRRFSWLTVLLLLGVAVWPNTAAAQFSQVPQPPLQVPWPFGKLQMDQGGPYLAAEFLWMRQSNPLRSQPIAFRGLTDVDGTLGIALGIPSFPGKFLGSHADALDVHQVSGPNDYAPGWRATLGYRWENGVSAEVSWL